MNHPGTDWLVSQFPSKSESDTPVADGNEVLNDKEVFEHCVTSATGDKFNPLWNGEWAKAGYKSHSEADLALANYLQFYTHSKSQCYRLWAASPLGKTQQHAGNYRWCMKWIIEPAFRDGKKWEKLLNTKAVEITGVTYQDAEDIKIRATRWLWPPWIPETLVILAGRGGSLKSTIAYTFAAIVASEDTLPWPDGTFNRNKGNVVIWSSEDSSDCIIPSRLKLAGYRRGKYGVKVITGVPVKGKSDREFDPAIDMDNLVKTIKEIGNVRLVIIDPMISIVTGDNHKANDVTRSLAPLIRLVKEQKCTVIGILHFNKAKMYDRAIDRINGSASWGNVSRMVLEVAVDQHNPEGVITRAKTNLTAKGGGYRFTAEFETMIDDEGIGHQVMKLKFDSNMMSGSPEEILATVEQKEEKEEKRERPAATKAETYLRTQLIQGPRRRKKLVEEAEKLGYSERSLERMFIEMKLESRTVMCPDGMWAYWGEPFQFDSEMWKNDPHKE